LAWIELVLGVLRPWYERALRTAERRLPALTRYRQSEPLPIALHARRIYIIPTGFGVFFAIVLTVMLLGGLNFNNNAALLMTFLVGGAVVVSMPRTARHLDRVRLTAVRVQPVHAGEQALVQVRFVPADGVPRLRLRLKRDTHQGAFDLPGEGGDVVLPIAATRRGWMPVGRFTLATEYPLGCFYAWSVLHPDTRMLVYPRPAPAGRPLPHGTAREAGHQPQPGGEDWHGLRDYRGGDALRRVAWRASARHDRLLVKEFAEPQTEDVVLDWHRLHELDHERRIEQLTRWVLDAHREGRVFRLVLPDQTLGPAQGDAHRERCLRELALLP
jgi:uncharacterized protein (DUF58 family)